MLVLELDLDMLPVLEVAAPFPFAICRPPNSSMSSVLNEMSNVKETCAFRIVLYSAI